MIHQLRHVLRHTGNHGSVIKTGITEARSRHVAANGNADLLILIAIHSLLLGHSACKGVTRFQLANTKI